MTRLCQVLQGYERSDHNTTLSAFPRTQKKPSRHADDTEWRCDDL